MTHLFEGIELESIKSLGLASKNINDEDVKLLAEGLEKNTIISHLNLNHNNITAKGISYLADALIDKPITGFHMNGSKIKIDGHIRLAQTIATWQGLLRLDVNCSGLEDKGALALSNALKGKKLQILWFSSQNTISQDMTRQFIRKLDYTNMLHINFACLHLDDEDAKFLAGKLNDNTTISYLDFNHNHFTAKGISYLTDALIDKPITQFHMHGSKIGDKGHSRLSQAISKWQNLSSLNVDNTNLGDFGCGALCSSLDKKKLHNLWFTIQNKISQGTISQFIRNLDYTEMRSINFGNLNLDDEDVEFLATHLKDNTVINYLDLNGCNFTVKGFKILIDVLIGKPMTQLHISGNDIGDEGHLRLAQAIRSWQGLICLNINSTGLKDFGCGALYSSLSGKKIQTLHFSHGNKISNSNSILMSTLTA